MPPELVAQIRGILVAKEEAPPSERRKISAALPGLGFRIRDFQEHVPSHRGGFSVADFDLLVEKGIIRVGLAAGAARPGQGQGEADRQRQQGLAPPSPSRRAEPTPAADEPGDRARAGPVRPASRGPTLVRSGAALAFGAGPLGPPPPALGSAVRRA